MTVLDLAPAVTQQWDARKLPDLRAWYDAEWGQPKYAGYVQLAGTSGDNISTPDAVNLDMTGDIEVVMRVKVTDWSTGSNQTLAGKYASSGNQRSWRFYVSSTGSIGLSASVDGTLPMLVTVVVVPTVALPDATWIWLRMRLALSNGSNSVATLDTAPDAGTNVEPSSWTANGTNTGTIIAGVFNSTAPAEIGSFAAGTAERLAGSVGRCIVRDGIGGRVVADFNADQCYGPGYLNEGALPVDGGGSRYVPLRGVVGDYVWTADRPALRVTGDLEIVARVAMADWTPSTVQTVAARWSSGATGKSYSLSVDGSALILYLSTDGTTTTTNSSTAAPAFTDGITGWVKATRRASDGRIQFFTAPDASGEPGSWTQLGTDVTGPSGSLFAGTSFLACGAQSDGSSLPLAGRVYRAIVRNGIGGPTVADFDASKADTTGQANDGAGNGWLMASPKHHGNWTLGLPKVYDRSGNNHPPATFGAGYNQPEWLPWTGTSRVRINGIGNYLVAPHTPAMLAMTGDVEVVARLALDTYAVSSYQGVAARFDGPSGSSRSWLFRIGHIAGRMEFVWNDTGTNSIRTVSIDYPTTFSPGTTLWFRCAFDADDGAGNCVSRFYCAPDQAAEPASWTLLGERVTPTVAVINAGNYPLVLGSDSVGVRSMSGRIHRVIVRNGIGGITVADFDAALCGQGGYTDAQDNPWTVNRPTSGRKTVMQSPAARSARSVILFGTDDYIDVPAAAVPTFGIADAGSVLIAERQHATQVNYRRIFSTEAANNQGLQIAARDGSSVSIAGFFGDSVGPTLVGNDIANIPMGTRTVVSMSVSGRSATGITLRANAASPVVKSNAAVGVCPVNSPSRIGAPAFSPVTFAEFEFEALVLRGATTSNAEHAQLVASYNGAL